MNAALYFELVDSVARIDTPTHLEAVAARIAATPMHPLERRVLDRALRARTEMLAIQQQLPSADAFSAVPCESEPRLAAG